MITPSSREGLDEIVRSARRRAGLAHVTCHQPGHTCLVRLREAGVAREAVQAQAGHRSMTSTRPWLASPASTATTSGAFKLSLATRRTHGDIPRRDELLPRFLDTPPPPRSCAPSPTNPTPSGSN